MKMVLKILMVTSLSAGFLVANEAKIHSESQMFEKIKKDILDSSKVMAFSEDCFASADTLKEANICVEKGNKISKDSLIPLWTWTKEVKSEMIQNIIMFNKSIPCIKNTETMDALQKCLPKELK